MSNEVVISVRDISKLYELRYPLVKEDGSITKNLLALDRVSFDVKKGERIGIIGANGSGKSTLLKILSGITKPSSGQAEITGRIASILDIGAGFHSELTGMENIYLNGQLLGFSKKEVREKYDEIVAFSGIGKFIHEPVKHYSNGMYLRLAFSIMAHLDFDIYLLDEVLSVGDTNFQLKVNHFLAQKMASGKGTFLFVSHNISELRNLCTGFYVLDNGKMSLGEAEELVDEYIAGSFEQADTGLPFNHVSFAGRKQPVHEFISVDEAAVNAGSSGHVEEQQPLVFTAGVYIKQSCMLDVSFGVEDVLGKELLYVSTLINENQTAQKQTQGPLIIKAELPAYSLKKGQYILTVTIVVNGDNVVISRMKCVYFKINTSHRETGKLVEQRPNAPVIRGRWTMIKGEQH